MKDWKEDLFDRLPFYWEGENIESFLSVIASELAAEEESIKDIPHTRRLSEITDGEGIAKGVNLDKLARNVGQIRDKVKFIDDKLDINVEDENDEMFRTRTQWNIDVQQSDGIARHIKDLVTRGLIMYRVRTGLGGMVYNDKVKADSFLCKNPPKFAIPDEIDITDVKYIEPNDIYIFPNYVTELEMKATDSYHGKYGNLTNFYQIKLPWKALPWSEGTNSLQWRSQDTFDRPYFDTFNNNGELSFEHDLNNNYPYISVQDNEGQYITPDSVNAVDGEVSVDLSSYDIDGEWSTRLTGEGYARNFDSDYLSSGVLSIEHNLEEDYPPVVIYDDTGDLISPDSITYVGDTTVDVDLSSYTINGLWYFSVIGGEGVVSYEQTFGIDDIGAKEMTITHGLGTSNVHVNIINDLNTLGSTEWVKEVNDDKIKVSFPSSSTVSGEWKINISASRAKLPEDTQHGWGESVYTGEEEDLHIEPVRKLSELTRPAATEVELYGYGGMVWQSQDEFDDPENPPKDKHHGWGSRWDGDLDETDWAMENLDDFWVDY